MLQEGSLIDGKYRIIKEIGRGGMSVVYLALNERANKLWAIKAIRREGIQNFEAVKEGISSEAEILKRIRHPGLPDISDIIDDGDSLLIVMGYIKGCTLAQLVREKGAMPVSEVIRLGRQICSVLAFLHRQQPPVIYRDLKPANVMLQPDGMIVLIDFGTALELPDGKSPAKQASLGTRGYAAPEQYEENDLKAGLTVRTDIYGFGATLYYLLTGQPPAEAPQSRKGKGLTVPGYARKGIGKLVEKCTRPDPEERFASCTEIMQELRQLNDEYAGIHAKTGKAGKTKETGNDMETGKSGKAKRLRRIVLAALAVLCLGLAGFQEMNHAEAETHEELRKESSMAYLAQAKGQESMEAAKPYFQKALEADAGGREIYEAILARAQEDILKADGLLTGETAAAVNACLNSSASGGRTNLQILKEQDAYEYARILYEIGLWYFFLKGDTSESRMIAAQNYFAGILEEGILSNLPQKQQETVKLLYEMGMLTAQLNDSVARYGSEESEKEGYRTLFQALSALIDRDLADGCGKKLYAVRLCQQAAAMISEKQAAFAREKVSTDELLGLLENARRVLIGLGIAPGEEDYTEYLEAMETVRGAKKLLLTIGNG